MSNSLINIDSKLVDALVKEHLQAAVLSVLAEKKEVLLSEMAQRVLSVKVDENGNIGDYSSRNKYTWVEYAINKELREVIVECVKEQLLKVKPEIEKSLQREVAKSSGPIAKAIMLGLVESMKWDFHFKVNAINPKGD